MLWKDLPHKYPFPMGKYSLTQLTASFWYHRAFPFKGTLGGLWGCGVKQQSCNEVCISTFPAYLWVA